MIPILALVIADLATPAVDVPGWLYGVLVVAMIIDYALREI